MGDRLLGHRVASFTLVLASWRVGKMILPRLLRERTFRSLRHRDYRLYFYGQLVSFIGSWVQNTALMWLAYDTTGDPRWPAWILISQVGPTLFLGTLGGAVADRYPKRSIIVATQIGFLANAMLLCFLVATDITSPFLLLGIQLVSGVIQAFDLPARLAFVPELVPREDLVNAVGLNSLLFNSARSIGPAIAGGLFLLAALLLDHGYLPGSRVATLGAIWCFTLNAFSFAAVLVALRKIEHGRTVLPRTTKGNDSYWAGFQYLRSEPALAALLGLTGAFCVFAWPILTLLPPYTRLILGEAERTYSLLLSAFGGGALVGALATATFANDRRSGRFLLSGAAICLVGVLGLALVATFPMAVVCCMLMGLGMVLYLSTAQSTMQTSAPNHSRGKVMALWAMMLSGSSLPGHPTAGSLAASVPVSTVLFGMAAGIALATCGLTILVISGKLCATGKSAE